MRDISQIIAVEGEKKCESRGPLLASKFLQNVYGNIHCRFMQKPENFGGLLLIFVRIYVAKSAKTVEFLISSHLRIFNEIVR